MRREDFLIGMVVGASLSGGNDGPDARRDLGDLAAVALGDALLVELIGGGVDLHRLAGRWVAWAREAPRAMSPPLREALEHLQVFDAPASELAAPNATALAAALPAAVAAASPRSMVAGAFHVARLLDPRESTALCAAALTVAAATFLEGRRDFIPDVIAMLRSNRAPPPVLDVMLAVPRDRSAVPVLPAGDAPDPLAVTAWALWQAYHGSRAVDALSRIEAAEAVDPALGAVAGGLLGARDGLAAWPLAWRRRAESYAGPRRDLIDQPDQGA